MEHRIRVLLADDQSILADGIRSVLSSSGELEVVGIASDGFEALDLLEKCAPDVILMDIRMPNMNGVIATQEVKRRHPEVKVLILTTFDDSDYILNAINNGASGYLLKDTSAAALIDAIKNAIATAKSVKGLPSCIVCDCVKGKGLSYMENNNAWHKGVPTDEQYAIAVKELGGC